MEGKGFSSFFPFLALLLHNSTYKYPYLQQTSYHINQIEFVKYIIAFLICLGYHTIRYRDIRPTYLLLPSQLHQNTKTLF